MTAPVLYNGDTAIIGEERFPYQKRPRLVVRNTGNHSLGVLIQPGHNCHWQVQGILKSGGFSKKGLSWTRDSKLDAIGHVDYYTAYRTRRFPTNPILRSVCRFFIGEHVPMFEWIGEVTHWEKPIPLFHVAQAFDYMATRIKDSKGKSDS